MIAAPLQLGFLTIVREGGGWAGGYLVTNLWGRPLEFRLSTPVQPNRVQQILYGGTLPEYLCGEIIGKSLIEKTASPANVVLTDTKDALALRRCIEWPVAWIAPNGTEGVAESAVVRPADGQRGGVVIDAAFGNDASVIHEMLDRIGGLDLAEPFARIRDAVAEARKMGVLQRAG